ncbi:geranylgeranyl pyrophosphate synthase-like protein [Dothistroma septosporum NZE10]|uniref:Geranylgeranyl pyrophosphate synthase-like protein n=1 Tax=Dothistroma septosporum (strain NZE10 / CBS 128990) TaxID=675120 RepID=N1Q4F8_DOTSN|nr:geranylgeranyl pyrophosphate synthase-like protein [Dothistroma septosporum NZE10]
MINSDLINGTTSWGIEKENILKGPFDYIESHPGKDIRSQMIAAFNYWLQVPPASLQVITRVISMLHTASLLIDDVEDNSQLRRGIPVAHSIFGTAQTINSANYVYFCALQELLTLNNPEVIKIYTDELLNLHRGQGMDLFWRDTLTCPTEDDYLEMVGNKTGGLFRLAIKLMCAESPSHNLNHSSPEEDPTDYIPLVNTIGLLFQILDDYRNLSDTTYTHNKGLCEDLTEGKFSFPIIHAIRADPSNLVLINILKQKTTDDEVKRYAVSYMERVGSFSYTRRILRGLTKKALVLVDEVDGEQDKGEIQIEQDIVAVRGKTSMPAPGYKL